MATRSQQMIQILSRGSLAASTFEVAQYCFLKSWSHCCGGCRSDTHSFSSWLHPKSANLLGCLLGKREMHWYWVHFTPSDPKVWIPSLLHCGNCQRLSTWRMETLLSWTCSCSHWCLSHGRCWCLNTNHGSLAFSTTIPVWNAGRLFLSALAK
jgi:hypothetical protein